MTKLFESPHHGCNHGHNHGHAHGHSHAHEGGCCDDGHGQGGCGHNHGHASIKNTQPTTRTRKANLQVPTWNEGKTPKSRAGITPVGHLNTMQGMMMTPSSTVHGIRGSQDKFVHPMPHVGMLHSNASGRASSRSSTRAARTSMPPAD